MESEDMGWVTAGQKDVHCLPDEILLQVMTHVSGTASKPSDVVGLVLVCKRWRQLGSDASILRNCSRLALAVRASQWCPSARQYLSRAILAGSLEAAFMLGMILFYCFPEERAEGGRLLIRAGREGHAAALFAAAIISFNGSGWGRQSKDLKMGVALCARAAALGNVDAIRELGHCMLDGFGTKQDQVEGWKLLLQAHLMELALLPECLQLESSSDMDIDDADTLALDLGISLLFETWITHAESQGDLQGLDCNKSDSSGGTEADIRGTKRKRTTDVVAEESFTMQEERYGFLRQRTAEKDAWLLYGNNQPMAMERQQAVLQELVSRSKARPVHGHPSRFARSSATASNRTLDHLNCCKPSEADPRDEVKVSGSDTALEDQGQVAAASTMFSSLLTRPLQPRSQAAKQIIAALSLGELDTNGASTKSEAVDPVDHLQCRELSSGRSAAACPTESSATFQQSISNNDELGSSEQTDNAAQEAADDPVDKGTTAAPCPEISARNGEPGSHGFAPTGQPPSSTVKAQSRLGSRVGALLMRALAAAGSAGSLSMTDLVKVLRMLESGTIPDSGSRSLKSVLTYLQTSSFGRIPHPANAFLLDWFGRASDPAAPPPPPRGQVSGGLQFCGRETCGKPETRPMEFWRCSCCWSARYCSRSCQLYDWRLRHSAECRPSANMPHLRQQWAARQPNAL